MTMMTVFRVAAWMSVMATAPVSAGELDLTLPPSATPIGFPAADAAGVDARPAGGYDRNGLDTHRDGHGFDVSGSVSTGIGYSRGDRSSTFSSAHLRVAHDDNDDDARPSRFSLDIHVGTARGPGFIGPDGYGDGYRGGDGDGDGGFDTFRAADSRGGIGDIRERGRP